MKILFLIFGNQLSSSYVTNLFNTIERLEIEGHNVLPVFVDRNMDFFALNKIFKGETEAPMDGEFGYDMVIFSDMNILPDAKDFADIVSTEYNVFTFDVQLGDSSDAYAKTDDSIPMFCFGMKFGVLEDMEYPWFKPSVTSITDGIMGSFNESVMVLPYRMVRWA